MNAISVDRYYGIRYAAAERFEAPQLLPFDRVTATWDTPGPLSPQVPGMLEQMIGIDVASVSEDCLFLNVFAPSGTTSADRLPVLVWIHGGAYLNGGGSIPWYDGSSLAARGHVVVTINYRLGAFGYLEGGNWGTLDQICALQWVQQNIDGFGGDSGNVTIFGESAGGSAVISLMAAPSAEGLFHRVWSMSPSIRQLRTLDSAHEWAQKFYVHAGVANLDEARALSMDALLAAQSATIAMPNTNYDMFTPAAGGEGLPHDLLEKAAANPIPLSIGTNRDESLMFLAFDPVMGNADAEQWVKFVDEHFPANAEQVRSSYEAAREGERPVALIAAVQTDHVFRRPAQKLAEARSANGHDSWMYWFTWASPAFGGVFGSAHALDIPFAFDNLSAPGLNIMLGQDPPPQELATRFADEISQFSKAGRPSWPVFHHESRATFELNATSRLLYDPEPHLRALHS